MNTNTLNKLEKFVLMLGDVMKFFSFSVICCCAMLIVTNIPNILEATMQENYTLVMNFQVTYFSFYFVLSMLMVLGGESVLKPLWENRNSYLRTVTFKKSEEVEWINFGWESLKVWKRS